MHSIFNNFKVKLQSNPAQIGLWVSLGSAYAVEICASAGFDWLLIDCEHGPNNTLTVLSQLQAMAAYPTTPVVRIPAGTAELGEMLIKQYLDLGVQTLMVPMVETKEQAQHLVKAAMYPTIDGKGGIRGVANSRASLWGRRDEYFQTANANICLIFQVESEKGLENLTSIASTDGVDGIFIGPSDLSASMGYIGNSSHPYVQSKIKDALAKIRTIGKAAGILATSEAVAQNYLEMGFNFVAVGVDTNLLVRATSSLITQFKKNT